MVELFEKERANWIFIGAHAGGIFHICACARSCCGCCKQEIWSKLGLVGGISTSNMCSRCFSVFRRVDGLEPYFYVHFFFTLAQPKKKFSFKMSNETIQKLTAVLEKAHTLNINIQALAAIKSRPHLQFSPKKYHFCVISSLILLTVLWNRRLFNSDDCLLEMPQQFAPAFRPTENCAFCRNVSQVERVSDILPDEFERSFAYSARPVIVTDATVHWTATDVFDYWYFKEVYDTAYDDSERTNCQFFPVRAHIFGRFSSLPAFWQTLKGTFRFFHNEILPCPPYVVSIRPSSKHCKKP